MSTPGRDFMDATRLPDSASTPSDQMQGVPQPPLTREPDPACPRVDLPDPDTRDLPPLDLPALIGARRTLRTYAAQPLTRAELSLLLWATQGIQTITDRPATLRPVPSAGARHPFETFLLVNRVADVTPGLYQYAAREHTLALLTAERHIADAITAACLDQQHVRTSAVTFIWLADAYRTIWRYGERSYRYIHLDAGHVCQNLYLMAEAVDCGVCAIGAFADDRLNDLLGADGVEQFVVYVATLGKR